MRQNRERWEKLAALAAVEQDPKTLIKLIEELLVALEKRDRQLAAPMNILSIEKQKDDLVN